MGLGSGGRPRILLTGSAGGVGTLFRAAAADRFEVVCFDRVPTPGVPDALVADLADGAALERAARGCDTIVHLGGFPNPSDFLSVILPANVVGTFRMYEAAVRAGVKRVVFASSVQVEAVSWTLPPGTRVTEAMAAVPMNVYGASKVFGESLGRIYHHRHGLEVICLRLGHVVTPAREAGLLVRGAIPSSVVLTAADAEEILIRAVTEPGIGFAILPAYSRSALPTRDLEPLHRILGYEPREDAFAKWPRHAWTTRVRRRVLGPLFRLRWRWRRRAWSRWGDARRALRRRRPVRRVLVTGAAGFVATALREALGDRYEFVCLDRRPVPGVPHALVGDLADPAIVARAVRGCDAVLHFGGIRDEADFEREILPNNIVGTWHLYRAAMRGGVRRVVFASTVQAEEGWLRDAGPVSVRQPSRPLNFYAAAKILGEDLGRSMAARSTLSVIALRLGWVRVPEDPEWVAMAGKRPPRITLTMRDLAAIVTRALEVRDVSFALLPAYSRSARDRKDLSPLKEVLDYEPQDDPVEEYNRATER